MFSFIARLFQMLTTAIDAVDNVAIMARTYSQIGVMESESSLKEATIRNASRLNRMTRELAIEDAVGVKELKAVTKQATTA